jgi:hypothetical protein
MSRIAFLAPGLWRRQLWQREPTAASMRFATTTRHGGFTPKRGLSDPYDHLWLVGDGLSGTNPSWAVTPLARLGPSLRSSA